MNLVTVLQVSEATRAVVLKADLAYKRLVDATTATGIKARLKAANKGYYDLKPDCAAGPQPLGGRARRPADDTSHEVILFLNPQEQRRYNLGWYTVEELDAWLAGTGPIIKAAASAA